MNKWMHAFGGGFLGLCTLCFGVTGNLIVALFIYGSAVFLLERPHGNGLLYLGSAALVADLLGTQRFGTYLLLAAVTYVAQRFFIGRLRFTSPTNRRTLSLTCVVISAALVLTHSLLVSVSLFTVGCLLILISINYLLPDHSPHLRYANT